MPMRWRWPPRELVRVAVAPPRRAGRPARAARRRARSRSALAADAVDHERPRRRSSPTVMRGLSERVRVLEDDLHVAAQPSQLARREPRVRSPPSKRISPAVGSSSRSSVRPSVDLPQPDSPTRPSVSPRRTSRSTPSTAWTLADGALEEAAFRTGKYFLTARARTSASRRRRLGLHGLRLRAHATTCRARDSRRPLSQASTPTPAAAPAAAADPRRRSGRRRSRTAARSGSRAGQLERARHDARGSPSAASRRACRAAGSSRSRPTACRGAAGSRTASATGAALDDAAGVHDRDLVAPSPRRRRGRA